MAKQLSCSPIASLLTMFGIITISFCACRRSEENLKKGNAVEEIVYVQSSDNVSNAGVIFNPQKRPYKPLAVIWVHGWGVNFYSPSYVNIGRALADRGYTCITVNTRMHDIGNVETYEGEKRIRGGGVWGVGSDEVRDIAAWINFAEGRGFKNVILVGHSAGWSAVKQYQAETQDQRVAGIVLASGGVRADEGPTDTGLITQARRLVAEGQGEVLIRDLKRSFPSYTSAATLVDIINTPNEFKDFFGEKTANPGVARVHCPLLAFYGTNGDVGDEADLKFLKSCIRHQPSGPNRVSTAMIKHADHMYTGEEGQVATTIAKWTDTLAVAITQKK